MGKRKCIQILLAAFALLTFGGGCAKKDSPVSFRVLTNVSNILPGNDQDCAGNDATGPRLLYNAAEIEWKSTDELYIAAISIRFKANGRLKSDYSCDIGGDQLDATFTMAASGGKLGAPPAGSSSTTFPTVCALKCYGIQVAKDNVPFKITGEAKIIAFSINPSTKEQKSFTSRTTVFAQFTP